MTNASLFRRFAAADDVMLRGAMPKTTARELSALKDDRVRDVVATRNGARLVKVAAPLTVTVAELVAC